MLTAALLEAAPSSVLHDGIKVALGIWFKAGTTRYVLAGKSCQWVISLRINLPRQ